MSEHEPAPDVEEIEEIEELPEFDYADPLEREDGDELPGLDPILTIPPE